MSGRLGEGLPLIGAEVLLELSHAEAESPGGLAAGSAGLVCVITSGAAGVTVALGGGLQALGLSPAEGADGLVSSTGLFWKRTEEHKHQVLRKVFKTLTALKVSGRKSHYYNRCSSVNLLCHFLLFIHSRCFHRC